FEIEAKEEQAIKQAAAVAAPTLVRTETVGGLDRVGQILTGTGPTTGVIVSADGYIISSAFNFASRPSSILVTLSDGRRLAAAQVATDRLKRLILRKVEAENSPVPTAAPAASFHVGQWSIALGKTLDEAPSLSVGIVSALNRIWGKAIQTDAKISPVNYGGALVDIEGRVLGILVPLSPQATGEVAGVEWYDSGIGFAIPLVDVFAALERLKQGKDLVGGLMGITSKGQDIYEGQPTIDRVRYGSPAHQAGLKEGDIVTEIDGHPVSRQAQLKHALGSRYAGEKVVVKVKRGNETLSRELTLVDKLVPYESAYLGILPARDATTAAAQPGVGIRYVFADSPAAIAGLDRGQRILKFNDTEVASSSVLVDLVSRLRPTDRARLSISDGGQTRDVEVTLGHLPTSVATDLRPAPILPREKELADKELKTGRFSDKMPAHDHEFWAYVPEDYNPEFKYSLLVWLHPGGDTMEAQILKAWQTLCDERGIILVSPKAGQIAGWIPDEAEFVKETVEQFLAKYSIDRARVAIQGYGGSVPFTYQVAFKHRQFFRGISLVGAPIPAPPPDNEPDFRTQFYLLVGENDPAQRNVDLSARAVTEFRYPVTLATIPGAGHKYPTSVVLGEMATWIDSLDRI
ncbi:MAG: PDZ domain-containing protein, partial [Planctomycetes bacterium]|nr:PDZ domain-containing protein [Planctomycetota bacterium]